MTAFKILHGELICFNAYALIFQLVKLCNMHLVKCVILKMNMLMTLTLVIVIYVYYMILL